MLMGQSHGHMLMGESHGHMLMGQAHGHMLMGQAHGEAMTTFLKIMKIMKIDWKWTHIRLLGLRIKDFESQRCYQSNGTPPDPQN